MRHRSNKEALMRIKQLTPQYLFLAAFALLSSAFVLLWTGCQNSDFGTASGPTGQPGVFLEVKTTDSCALLASQLAGGTAADSAAFAAQCVVETPVPPVPPAMAPDSGTRCRWIRDHI